MAKLYFKYGAMGSAKTLNLLATAHSYRIQGKKVLLMKPGLDDRFGKGFITSRAGLKCEVDILLNDKTELMKLSFEGVACIVVDEAQFLSPKQIEELRDVAAEKNIPVLCYGLRNDFKTELFPGTKRLMELADTIEEIRSTCYYCPRRATLNLRFVDGIAVNEGPVVVLGAEETYRPACYRCYKDLIKAGQEQQKTAYKACIHESPALCT